LQELVNVGLEGGCVFVLLGVYAGFGDEEVALGVRWVEVRVGVRG
jgi:hypothetical protein